MIIREDTFYSNSPFVSFRIFIRSFSANLVCSVKHKLHGVKTKMKKKKRITKMKIISPIVLRRKHTKMDCWKPIYMMRKFEMRLSRKNLVPQTIQPWPVYTYGSFWFALNYFIYTHIHTFISAYEKPEKIWTYKLNRRKNINWTFKFVKKK